MPPFFICRCSATFLKKVYNYKEVVLYEKIYFFFSIFLSIFFLSCASRRTIYNNNRSGAYRVREDITRLEDEQQNITDGFAELDNDGSKKIKENAKREGSYIEFIKSGDRGEAEKNRQNNSNNIFNGYFHNFFDTY